MKILKSVLLILPLTFAFIGCGGGGGGGGSDTSTPTTPKTITLHKGESAVVNSGDQVKALSDDTQLQIVTDAATLQNSVYVLEGEAEVTKYN